jgi:hypothetical protein
MQPYHRSAFSRHFLTGKPNADIATPRLAMSAGSLHVHPHTAQHNTPTYAPSLETELGSFKFGSSLSFFWIASELHSPLPIACHPTLDSSLSPLFPNATYIEVCVSVDNAPWIRLNLVSLWLRRLEVLHEIGRTM